MTLILSAGLLALACIAGVAINLLGLPDLLKFIGGADALKSEGVTEAEVRMGLISGVVTAYGAMLLMLVFVALRHRWARFAWIGCVAFTLLTEAPMMVLHWTLVDTLAMIDSIGAGASVPPKVPTRAMMFTPEIWRAKLSVLIFLCAATPTLFLPSINRWMRR